MSESARPTGAERAGGDDEVAAESPAKQIFKQLLIGRGVTNPEPGARQASAGAGARQASAGGENDGPIVDLSEDSPGTQASNLKRLMKAALEEGQRIANLAMERDADAASSRSSFFDQVAHDDKKVVTMDEGVTHIVQRQSVVVIMQAKDDGEKAQSSKFKVAKQGRQTPDDWLRATRKKCASVVMRMILAALAEGDFYGAAPTFSKRQLDACRQLKDGFDKFDPKWPEILLQLRKEGNHPYQGFRLNLRDVAEVIIRMPEL